MEFPARLDARLVQRAGSDGTPIADAEEASTGNPKHASFSFEVSHLFLAGSQNFPWPVRNVGTRLDTTDHVARQALSPK